METADRALWEAWRARRDEGAFQTLVAGHLGFATDFARRLGCTPSDADDLVQETLVRLARERGDRPVDVGIRAWIGRTISLRSKMLRRAEARRARRERRALPTVRVESSMGDATVEIDRALASLPDSQREAVTLRFLHDMDYAEMARVLGLSESACRIRVHRGIEALRRRLGDRAPALLAAMPLFAPSASPESMVGSALASAGSASVALVPLGGLLIMKNLVVAGILTAALGVGAIAVFHAAGDNESATGIDVAPPATSTGALERSPASTPPRVGERPPANSDGQPAAPPSERSTLAALLARVYGGGGKAGVRKPGSRGSAAADIEWLASADADLAGRAVIALEIRRDAQRVIPELGLLQDVVSLRVSVRQGGGAAPLDASALPILAALEDVQIDGAKTVLSTVNALARQPSLRRIELSHGEIDAEALRALAALSRVESLSLDSAAVADDALAALAPMQSLRRLKLDETRVTDDGLAHVSGMRDLADLDLTRTRVTGKGFARLAGLAGLRKLTLEGARIDDDGLANVIALAALETIDLESTDVTDAGVVRLGGSASLVDVNLERTRVADAGLLALARIPTLRKVNVGRTSVTADGIARFKSLRPDVRVRD